MQSYSGVIVHKNGDIKETTIKSDDIEHDLYKKCNFRKSDGFGKQCEWKIKMNKVAREINELVSLGEMPEEQEKKTEDNQIFQEKKTEEVRIL